MLHRWSIVCSFAVITLMAACAVDLQIDALYYECETTADCGPGHYCSYVASHDRMLCVDNSFTDLLVDVTADPGLSDVGSSDQGGGADVQAPIDIGPLPDPCGDLGTHCPASFVCTPASTCVDDNSNEVFVPAGQLWMGCSGIDKHCNDDEKPGHLVSVPAFAISRHEVTVRDYRERCSTCVDPMSDCTGCNWGIEGRDEHPVNGVTWDLAQKYCAAQGPGYRLCSEAEWEMAARGSCEILSADCETAAPIYPWGDQTPVCDMAHIACGGEGTVDADVSDEDLSPYGVLGMAGNVREWIMDSYHSSYEDNPPTDGSAWHVPSGRGRVDNKMGKGGAYTSDAEGVRITVRTRDDVQYPAYGEFGVRCCRSM